MLIIILIIHIIFLNTCQSWEYCQYGIENKLCENQPHFICDCQNSILNPFNKSKEFLAHVPLTRKVKASFLNWHNYYRNRTAGGWAKNKKKIYFPRAIRMRELKWDSELSYLSHMRTKVVCAGEVSCINAQRFPFVAQNLIVEAQNDPKPVLEIIASSLKKMFNKKNLVKNPTEMPNKYLQSHKRANQFITMVNDRVSRLGCAVALGADCGNKHSFYKFCYYTACTYDEDNEDAIYKIGKPARKCSRWEVGRSKTYINLCANSGKIFKRNNNSFSR